MSYNLFLDDERTPQRIDWVKLPDVPWVIVRSYESFIGHISKFGLPDIISFDHDLADEHYERYFDAKGNGGTYRYEGLKHKTGRDAALWLVRYCETFQKPIPQYFCHTKNEYGEQNIRAILDAFKLSPRKKRAS